MIAIVTAMEVEFMGICQKMLGEGKTYRPSNGALMGTLKDKRVVAIQSGIGKDKAARAISFLSDEYPLRLIISTGVAGALSPELRTGDIVIGEKVLSSEGGVLFSDRTMIDACDRSCKRLGMSCFSGTILTASEFVTSTDKKAKLHREYGAMAVEMESAYFAGYAAEKGIPFLVVRAISDRADTCFNIDFQRLKNGGRVVPWKSLKYFSLHPILYLEFRKHRKNLAMAASRLHPLIEEIIDQLN